MPEDRRLAAIMFTDIVGYTALMGSDEDKAFDMLKRNHTIHETLIKKHKGKLIKEIGDGTLASFSLASDAVRCALDIQKEAKSQNIPLKIGIHEGEMVLVGADVLGDAVNVASRLQESAEEGCISISGKVYSDVKNKAGIEAEFIEEQRFKNVDEPVKVYKVRCEEQEEPAQSTEQPAKKNRVLYYVIAGLVVVIAVILIWQFLPTRETGSASTEVSDKSIAVLPFRDDSPDQKNEYLCNGIVESILTNLQKIGDLRVKSRTDIEQYRKPDKDLKAIARELKVAFILEGSVQRIGDNLRITAQLIDGNTGDHLWADEYGGKYTDEIFVFQSDVAKKVASSLQVVITPAEEKRIDHRSTNEIMAYDLYWRGLDMVEQYDLTRDLTYIGLANNLFDKALDIDPVYAKAVAGKGHAYKMVALYTDGNYDSAMIYADMAIQLDPEDQFGYSLMGSCYQALQMPDHAIEYYLKAIELEPNYNWPYELVGMVYCEQKNDYIRGIPYIEKAVKLEGRALSSIFDYAARMYLHIGDYKKATEYYKHSIDLLPNCYNNIYGYFMTLASQEKFNEIQHFIDSICNVTDCGTMCSSFRFRIHILLNAYDQAEASLTRLKEFGGPANVVDSIYSAYLDKKIMKENEGMSILENLKLSFESKITDNSPWWYYYNLASVLSILGNNKEAIEYLAKAVDAGLQYGTHDFMETDPTFENLWDDPEFKAIVKRAQDEKAAIRGQIREMEERGELDL